VSKPRPNPHSLIQNHCNFLQGYLFSKPVPPQEVFEWLGQRLEFGKKVRFRSNGGDWTISKRRRE